MCQLLSHSKYKIECNSFYYLRPGGAMEWSWKLEADS